MNIVSKYLFYLNSQLIFLVGLTIALLFLEPFNHTYTVLFVVYFILLFYPFIYLEYIKQTNSTNVKVKGVNLKELNFKNYISPIMGFVFALLLPITSFFNKNISIEFLSSLSWFRYVYIMLLILFILSVIFLLQTRQPAYILFENFIFLNILKFKILEVENIEGKIYYVFTRKNTKKHDFIQGLKHLFEGVYYY